MKRSVLISMLSGVLFSGTGINIAQANGFFQENSFQVNKDTSVYSSQAVQIQAIYDSYQMSYDDYILDTFILEEQNPHNYYNPYRQNYNPQSKSAKESFNLKKEASETLIPEFQFFISSLDEKSEQAILHNSINVNTFSEENIRFEDENADRNSFENGTQLASIELSQLTGSALIVSARKKQFYEKLLPALLINYRTVSQDRQRLEQLLIHFEKGNKIAAVDELWLNQMAKDYHLSERILRQL